MALVSCPECGRENISDKAGACPSCGFPIRPVTPTQPLAQTQTPLLASPAAHPVKEQILFNGKASVLAWATFNTGLIGLMFHVCTLFVFAWLKSYMNKIVITTTHISFTSGLISQHEERIELFRVRDTKYEQGILQRLIGTGTITIISTDRTNTQISFPMERSKQWINQIRDCIQDARRANNVITMDH